MHREPSWARSRSSSWGFYTKLLYLILHKAPQLYSVFLAIRRHSSVPRFSGPTQTRAGVCHFFHTATETRVRLYLLYCIYYIFQYRLWRVCMLVCLFICSFVCLFRSVCFLVSSFYSTATETRIPLLSTISCCSKEQLRFSVERSPWRAWRPTTPRQSSRTAPSSPAGRNKESFQEYKSKLRVCLSLYSKAVFEVFQGKARPSSTLDSTDTATLNAVAGNKWLQANQDLWSVLLLTTSGSANTV